MRDTDPDGNPEVQKDKYVKVLLADGSAKFVDKTKLPYVKIRVNTEYFFVCVYDLKNTWKDGNNHNASYSGVRIIDDSIAEADISAASSYKTDSGGAHDKASKTIADVFINNEDRWYDTWGINNTLLNNVYKLKYTADHLEFQEQNGVRYFMIDSNLIAKYRKVTVNSQEYYVEEDKNFYYTKVNNNANNDTNYIIVDEKGNILTKPLTAPEVLGVNTVTANDNLTTLLGEGNGSSALYEYWNTFTRSPNSDEIPGDIGKTNGEQYVGQDVNRAHKDYRIPALERVYHATLSDGFNLSSASGYSYFQIPELRRANYTYLNVEETKKLPEGKWHVEDMFFTTQRAAWVD